MVHFTQTSQGLRKFPELEEIRDVTLLDLSGNRITEIPIWISELRDLSILKLTNNSIYEIPQQIFDLPHLQTLDVGNNNLGCFPEIPEEGTSIRTLILRNNVITRLHPSIKYGQEIVELDLRDNNLPELPYELTSLALLQDLRVDGNPLQALYYHAIEANSTSGLISFLSGLHSNSSPFWESKLIVTGEGRVGKSWTLAALRGDNPRELGDQTTYGIDRDRLRLKHPKIDDVQITMNTWDFGGQDVYRLTHQFFFSEEAIYLLVWNPRDGPIKCRVHEWLKTIFLRTNGNAKVIMVATHSPSGERSYFPDFNYAAMEPELREMIVDTVEIDNESGSGVEYLRKAIARKAIDGHAIGRSFPDNWRSAREEALRHFKEDGEPYISFEKFKSICSRQQPPVGEVEARTLATAFMHRSGQAIYYSGANQGILRTRNNAHHDDAKGEYHLSLLSAFLILDPQWLSRAFVQVLEDEEVIGQSGILDHDRLLFAWNEHGRDDWNCYDPATEHPFLLELLHSFDVSFVLPDERFRSFIPQLAPHTPPTLLWDEEAPPKDQQVVSMTCQISDSFPGLIPWFIVKTFPHHVVVEENGRKTQSFWRQGIFLRDRVFGNEALVKQAGTERPTISILVSGPCPGWFVGTLHGILESLFERLPGLKRKYSIRCPSWSTENVHCDGQFPLNFLVRQGEKSRRASVPCQGSCGDEYDVSALLLGTEAVVSGQSQSGERYINQPLRRYLELADAPCPRLYSIAPVSRKKYNPLSWLPDKVSGKKLRLTVYSELSGSAAFSYEF